MAKLPGWNYNNNELDVNTLTSFGLYRGGNIINGPHEHDNGIALCFCAAPGITAVQLQIFASLDGEIFMRSGYEDNWRSWKNIVS